MAALYQKSLTNDAPYDLIIRPLTEFVEHRHADIEFNYCIKGSRTAIVDKKHYEIKEGEILIISPGVTHEFPASRDPDRRILTGVVGSSFLKKYFSAFSNLGFRSLILDLSSESEGCALLKKSLDCIIASLTSSTVQSSMIVTGELYKICAYLLDFMVPSRSGGPVNDGGLVGIDRALQLIYYDYKKAVTVEEAAEITGYGKSNFCKIFKRTTGMTFHEALNKRRLELACRFLSETRLPIAEISEEVGFGEPKNFCRMFKSKTGLTPGAYRREQRSKPADKPQIQLAPAPSNETSAY